MYYCFYKGPLGIKVLRFIKKHGNCNLFGIIKNDPKRSVGNLFFEKIVGI